jgi:hypothetical protein
MEKRLDKIDNKLEKIYDLVMEDKMAQNERLTKLEMQHKGFIKIGAALGTVVFMLTAAIVRKFIG